MNPTPAKTPRRVARELALQGLYQWQLTGNSIPVVEDVLQTGEETGGDWSRADRGLTLALLRNAADRANELEAEFVPFIDRPIGELSPIERSILLLGTYELKHCPETPYRVVINEAIELAKNFGGTEGHRFVNGVLDKLVPRLREAEIEHAKKNPPQRK
ncbi:MAG: transcription antitermination factor NusB [Betaproteobacteria bacterium]|nr:transcription antitermination factor NusB [Betaproteobacteria bacterium]